MDDSQTPATKEDLQGLERIMETRFERVHEDIDCILEVLVYVDKRLKGKREDHEKRIVRLEKAFA